MAKSYLPDADHIVRHCNSQQLIREGEEVIGIFPHAFLLRDNEKYLSASWLEFFPGNRSQRIDAVIKTTAACRTVKPSHGFAIGNVSDVKEACAGFGQKLRIVHEPSSKNPNPAYTAVRQFRSDDLELLQLLAMDAWSELIVAKGHLD